MSTWHADAEAAVLAVLLRDAGADVRAYSLVGGAPQSGEPVVVVGPARLVDVSVSLSSMAATARVTVTVLGAGDTAGSMHDTSTLTDRVVALLVVEGLSVESTDAVSVVMPGMANPAPARLVDVLVEVSGDC